MLPPGVGFLVGIPDSWRFNWKEVQRDNLKSISECGSSILSGHITYRSDIFFVELRPDDCGLDEVFDICYTWEPA